MLHEIKHRYTGAVLFSLECGSLKPCVEVAISSRANLSGANLSGADLSDANIIDGGQDRRGFRFWCWREQGMVVYRAGCHEWRDIEEAFAWYGDTYASNGNRAECSARLTLMCGEAARRWPE